MNKEERLREQLLLKERWGLITSGTDRKHIKIRGNKLLVNNQIYGEVINSNCIRNQPQTSSGGSSTMDVNKSTTTPQ